MAISNHTVVALGILTRRAKKNFGIFKVSDIVKNEHLAFELLTKATLSGDQELRSLAVELNKSLKIQPNLINALDVYLSATQHANANSHLIKKNLTCLSAFVKHLDQVELDNVAYRHAVNNYLQEADVKDYTFCADLIRNFYPYWSHKDPFSEKINKKISHFKPQSHKLIALWKSLDNKFLTASEDSLLNDYLNAIKTINIEGDEFDVRLKIAKLIIIKQRDFKSTASGYRQNIEELKDYFSNDNLLDYFLSLVREFYVHWSDIHNSTREPKAETLL